MKQSCQGPSSAEAAALPEEGPGRAAETSFVQKTFKQTLEFVMIFVLALASSFMTAFDIREHFLFTHDTCSQSELKAGKPVHN